MKRFITTALLGLGFCHSALASPITPVYYNYGPPSSPPTIDAIGFYNSSAFEVNTLSSFSNLNTTIGLSQSSEPYSTFDTLYVTNTVSGTMSGIPGFQFDTVSSSKSPPRRSSRFFVNHGVVMGEDLPAIADYNSTVAGTTALPGFSQPLASRVVIDSTNILNNGTLEVGNYGLLQLNGISVSNNDGALIAGAVNTGGITLQSNGFEIFTNFNSLFTVDPIDTTGRGDILIPYFVDPPFVYDLYWGATNGGTLNLANFSPPETTGVNLTGRQGATFLFDFSANYGSYLYTYNVGATDIYYNVVFVDTNFADTNISATVGFGNYFQPILDADFGDPEGAADIVQFAEPVFDVITGQTVTNAVYLVDAGAIVTNVVLYNNSSTADNYDRPEIFEITTSTPEEWIGAQPPNGVYDPSVIYASNSFVNFKVPYIAGEYAAQIGRNVENLGGTFGTSQVSLPDPTNEAGRIEITARQLDMTRTRIRAEGMVSINATNLVGGSDFSPDWGEINSSLGATNGALVVSNFYPATFQRVRGSISAYAVTFQNVFTNATLTNVYHYHILVVGQDLRGSFHSSIRNLKLAGKSSISVQDPLYVINQSLFETTNLYFNASVQLTGNAGNLTPTNMPLLRNFFNDTNGDLAVDSIAAIGFNPALGQASPTRRKYSVLSITNFGHISATAPLLQSAIFENDGTISTTNNGSIVIEAESLGLGLALTNTTNTLVSEENVTLSAKVIQATDSHIYAGNTSTNGNGELILQTTSDGEITDFVSGAPSTNATLVNYWQVTGGFSLPVKPATGDLFGTQIKTIVNGTVVSEHIWAGADLGPVPAGFANNVVIGHLTLSRETTNSQLRFSGAGAKNGMYVDYLELDPNSQSYGDYHNRNGLIIDPNLTIYFADSNVDPLKLEDVYSNRLVWVQNFSGPNSTVAVRYENSSNVCLLNAALAFSPDVSFFGNTPNFYNQPYVLNNPTNAADTYPCPGEASTAKAFIVKTSSTNSSLFTVSVMGGGRITPPFRANQVFTPNTSYTFTAVASNGWFFSGWSAPGLTIADTNSTVLKFTYEPTVAMITANFTPDPFTLSKGVYNGLFFDTNNPPSSASSGFFTLTLAESGHFSGRLMMGPAVYPFSSTFLPNGTAQVTAKRGKQSLTVNLQLDLTGVTGQVHGDVRGAAWDVQLQGNISAGNPSPLAGRYTMSILPNTNGTSSGPGGYGYGTLTVNKAGLLTVAGRLADGAAFSQSAPISKSGQWPFYAATGRDLILGWIVFQPNGLSVTNLSGSNFWSRTSGGQYYSKGFTNTFEVIGSPYSTSKALNLTSPIIMLDSSSIPLAKNGKLGYSGELDGKNLSLSIKAATGIFSGRIGTTNLNGVVLQNQEDARGFSLGTAGSSAVLLMQGN